MASWIYPSQLAVEIKSGQQNETKNHRLPHHQENEMSAFLSIFYGLFCVSDDFEEVELQ